MSDKYRQLLRKRNDIELGFTDLKISFTQQKLSIHNDTTLDDIEFGRMMDDAELQYQRAKRELIVAKHRLEDEIANEIDEMNRTSVQAGRSAVFRLDGKIDFGKAFLFLADQCEKILKKLDALMSILVENE